VFVSGTNIKPVAKKRQALLQEDIERVHFNKQGTQRQIFIVDK
jgi:hypothetical protein